MQDNDKGFSPFVPIERNVINLFGEIDTPKAEIIIAQLQYLDDKFERDCVPMDERIITLQLNSVGGEVTAGLAILDTINYCRAQVRTICLGISASMAAVLLSAGTRGMRFATEHSEILIHQPLGGTSGQASDIIIAADHIKNVRQTLNGILAENTGKSMRQIEKDTDRDTIMTAAQAREYGLIDEVIYSVGKAKMQSKLA